MSRFYHIVGQNIIRLRKANKISQREAGEFLGVTFQQIQKYENAQNRLPLDRAVKLCELYKTTIEEIIGEQE